MSFLEYARQFKLPFDPPRCDEEAYFEAHETATAYLEEEGGTGDLDNLIEILMGATS